MHVSDKAISREDTFNPARSLFRKLVHFFSYHFILKRNRSTVTRVSGLDLTVLPTVFHPKIFLTSGFFADYLQSLDFTGKDVIEVGTGSGILSLSAARAGAISVLALDINQAAVDAANLNAANNGLLQVTAIKSDLFSAIPATNKFDVIISSPPSFSGEPRDDADRAWHAGPGYRDILALFEQAAERIRPNGKMYILLSSDTNLKLMDSLISAAGFKSKKIAQRSIWVEAFYLYELSLASSESEISSKV
jgi:release factor glutamine methyltransferase